MILSKKCLIIGASVAVLLAMARVSLAKDEKEQNQNEEAERIGESVSEQADFKLILSRVAEHIKKRIESRQKLGQLKDQDDNLAILVSSVRQLREEIEDKTGIELEDLVPSDEDDEPRNGMPRGMRDVGHTSLSGATAMSLAKSLPILFADPQSLTSLTDLALDDDRFQDYIKLVEEQDPDLRKQKMEVIRARTIEYMRGVFKDEMKKLSVVFLNRFQQQSRLSAARGDLMGAILFQIQAKILECLLNVLIDVVSEHGGTIASQMKEFTRGIKWNSVVTYRTEGAKYYERPNERGRWMMEYMID